MIYLDSAATTSVRREVLEAMWPLLIAEYGNPSSHNEAGVSAAAALAEARSRVAAVFGCRPSEVVFTSGGTEGANLAVIGIALANPRGRHIVTSAIEHPAVLESCAYLERFHGFEITRLAVDGDGLVGLPEFSAALRADTTLASVMYANNEIGTVQPISSLALAAHAVGAAVHTDAVQAPGSLPLQVSALGVDALSISGHKFGAPKGIGAVFLASRIAVEPLVHGGGQERGRRSGTENVAGAVGLAVALELAELSRARAASLAEARDGLIRDILAAVPSARLTGSAGSRLAGNASFTFAGTSGESIVLELERRGIVCSSGSACAAGSDEPSAVLLAVGISPEVAQTAVRFSFTEALGAEELGRVAREVTLAVAAIGAGGTN
ncbi:cysteine desulfurase family protein [Frigoribacterium sp. UYMn621]|uniref:cysteine desulfurase family protein n=1 Tax=Frigoribacterium sp. UYMn621 TaxID=3156343 RepID=UPI003393D9B2